MMGISKGAARRTLYDAFDLATDECVLWPHAIDPGTGYGQITIDKARRQAHVVVLERCIGPRPSPRYEAAHSCNKRACINWRHLRWATGAENQADRLIHGTDGRGERNPMAKLTEADVRLIRHLRDTEHWTQRGLANRFGVTRSHISQIMSRRVWGWLE